jgi:hypothetical protein
MKKEILLGTDKDTTIYTIELESEQDYRDENTQYCSLTGSYYDKVFITEEMGEQRAKQYLEDDNEMWKQAVANDSTTSSLEEWNQEVLSIDGWQHILGDIYEIYDKKRGICVYASCSGGGQIQDSLKDLEQSKLTTTELKTLKTAWKKLHLKEFKKFTNQDAKLYDKLVQIFCRLPKFEYEQLLEYGQLEGESTN